MKYIVNDKEVGLGSYLKYYFSGEGQRRANFEWDYNGYLMHHKHDEDARLANIEWKKRKDKEDAEIKAFVDGIIKKYFTKKEKKRKYVSSNN